MPSAALRRASQTALGSVVKSSNAPARDSEALQRRLVRAVRAQTDFAMSTPIAVSARRGQRAKEATGRVRRNEEQSSVARDCLAGQTQR
jgi:hypothetical protein